MIQRLLSLRPDASGGPASSGLRLFNALLVIRWASLAVAGSGYLWNLRTDEVDYGYFVPAMALAFLYMLALSWFARPIYEFHMRNLTFLVIDYAVVLVLWTMTGTVWNPFLVFGGASAMLAGLYATPQSGLGGAVGLSAVFGLALWLKGMTWSELVGTDGVGLSIAYNLEFLVFSIAWAYAAAALGRLTEMRVELEESRDVLSRANTALDERRAQLLALNDVRRATLLMLEDEETIGVVLRALSETGLGRSRVWLAEGERLRLVSAGADAGDLAMGDALAAEAAARREILVVRTNVSPGAAAEVSDGPGDLICVPMLSDGELLGVAEVGASSGETLSEEQTLIVRLFVDQIVLALTHARLYGRAREHAVLQERNRITVQIHDTVVGRLREASKSLASARDLPEDPELRRRIALLADTIKGGLQDLRVAVLNWDSMEWRHSLEELVERYAREFANLSGMSIALESSGEECVLSADRMKDLLRILHETLSNAWRHGDARSVRVVLMCGEEGVSLTIEDDGTGFDQAAAARGTGIGLRSIRSRSERGGGSLDIATSPGAGTTVRVWMPC